MTTKRIIPAGERMEMLNEGMLPGASVVEICRKHGVGTTTHYRWKRQALSGAAEAVKGPSREVIALKQENARIKKLVAESALLVSTSKGAE